MGGKSVRMLAAASAMWFAAGMSGVAAQSVAARVSPDASPTSAAARVMVTVRATQEPLESVLKTIAQQAGLRMSFMKDVMPTSASVTMSVRNVPASDAFAMALRGTGFVAVIALGNVAFVEQTSRAAVAQGSVSGQVVDAKTHQGLRGVTVTLVGTNKGTTSGSDGGFRFSDVVPGSYTIQVRMLGYLKGTKPVTVSEGQTTSIEVVMEPSVNALDQVIVTGTVAATELRAVPNAITVITAKQLEDRNITHIDQLFRGDVPGLFSLELGGRTNGTNGEAFAQVAMFSRGATKLESGPTSSSIASNTIKTYVDGIELVDPDYLNQIDPRSIERIEIIAGPQASTIYGSNAINGVMQIFTKRGTAGRPRVTVQFQSGFQENNLSTALAPRHDANVSVSGIEGRISYNAGGSWNYMGSWTPGRLTNTYSGYAGGRVQFGPLSVDANARRVLSNNREAGSTIPKIADLIANGTLEWNRLSFERNVQPFSTNVITNTFGGTLNYAVAHWWSHTLTLGTDGKTGETISTRPKYYYAEFDTSGLYALRGVNRTSQKYVMTLSLPILSVANLDLTSGADHWRTTGMTVSAVPLELTGSLRSPTVTRVKPDRNSGVFAQGRLSVLEKLFFTYGLRAEWNPNYGENARVLPGQYGIAYSSEFGVITAKLRAAYGRSTRPPGFSQKDGSAPYTLDGFPLFKQTIENPDLGPEFQQGGEGGLEVYLGSRASLVVTRYNQTVDGLIAIIAKADSVAELFPGAYNCQNGFTFFGDDGRCYYRQSQYINVGDVRNQGWDLTGSVNTGPFTTRGTYSWVKSRMIGITPKYRSQLTSAGYGRGYSFNSLAEHTWFLGITYARSQTSLAFNINGIGQNLQPPQSFWAGNINGNKYRIVNTAPRSGSIPTGFRMVASGYWQAGFNARRMIHRGLTAMLNVNNITDYYRSDASQWSATPGRETQIGFQWTL